jgi:sortase B
VFKVNPADFPYHQFVNAADEVAFDEYVSRCKALSFYDTGVTAAHGDKLITLSTCEYTRQGNRLVVVAKRIV